MTDITRRAGLVLALCLPLTSCGGSDTLSRGEFVARADAICRDGQGEFAAIQATPPRSGQEAAEQVKRLIATVEAEIIRLDRLEPPEALTASFDAYVKTRRDTIPLFRKAETAARGNKPQDYADAWSQITAGQPARYDLARKAGLKICSRPQLRSQEQGGKGQGAAKR